MTEIRGVLRSRGAQGVGFGVAALLVFAAIAAAAVTRHDAQVRAVRDQAALAQMDRHTVAADAFARARTLAAALAADPALRRTRTRAERTLAARTQADPLVTAATLSRGGVPVAGVVAGLPVSPASIVGAHVARLAPGRVALGARTFSLGAGGRVLPISVGVPGGQVLTLDVSLAKLDAAVAAAVPAAPHAAPSLARDLVWPLLLALVALSAAAALGWSRRHGTRLPTHDPVTMLPNRRQLLLDLPRRLAAATDAQPAAFVLAELDGFKGYNDRFGHQAGDKLLSRLARRVEATVAGRGVAYRLGGGEFCVVASSDPELGEDELVVSIVAALTEVGDGFAIVPRCGVVALPAEASDVTVALRVADQRLYANKQSGRRSAGRQSTDVLLRALSERSPELGSHLHDVAELAGQVAARMGMSDEEIDHVLQAAELHDVGKMAIPDAILKKPGPLDNEEWSFIRGHTVIGERIVAAAPALAPVARLIRSSHERWDGTGYPDRMAQDEIPLGSRIIAVCDAFDAMIGPRPHRLGMTEEQAVGELRRCAGTQFDPEVVRIFATAFESLVRGGRAAA